MVNWACDDDVGPGDGSGPKLAVQQCLFCLECRVDTRSWAEFHRQGELHHDRLAQALGQ